MTDFGYTHEITEHVKEEKTASGSKSRNKTKDYELITLIKNLKYMLLFYTQVSKKIF